MTMPDEIENVDTPGLHKLRTLLGQRLNDLVREALLEAREAAEAALAAGGHTPASWEELIAREHLDSDDESL